ncbi:MAG: hypothetical protein JTT11_01010 [Candidatus Brockarchaeota archaeon]|nr:hypothetical protein [Candidatus Brockarchaeota archaeon]
MEKKRTILAILVLLSCTIPNASATDPSLSDLSGTGSSDWTQPSASTVASSISNNYPTAYSHQRKIFYANGLFWAFYSDGTNMVFRTSRDGLTWSSSTTARTSVTYGDTFSVFFDGTYFHYAYTPQSANTPIYYRRGTPNSGGTVTWSAAEQTAVAAGGSTITYYAPSIMVATDGRAWIGYRLYDSSAGTRYPWVTRNNNIDGTWSAATNFPYQLSTFSASATVVTPVPLTSGYAFVLYTSNGFQIRGRKWTGSWASEVITSGYVNGQGWSATNEGDDVHLCFTDSTNVRYTKYTSSTNSFSSETVVQSGGSPTSVVVSLDTAINTLYCFWANSPTANHVYYKKKNQAGTWDTNPTDWIDETTDTIPAGDRFTSFYKDCGGKIGLAYVTGTSPYKVRFRYIDGSYDIAGKTGVMGLQAGSDADSLAFAIKLDYALIGFRVSRMALGEKYEVNFTIGSMDFSMMFVATASSRGKFALCYKPGGSWTAAETIDKSASDIASGTRYESGTGNTAFKLTDSTSSNYGYVKLEVKRSYLTSLGATGYAVTNIVGRTYCGSSTTTLLPGPQGGTKIDRCPSGSSTASYTMVMVPEFPLGILILTIPLVAIHFYLGKRRTH